MEERITDKNIDEAEKETIRVASSTISALESALASWDASKSRPEELADKFRSYARLRDELAAWMTRMLRSAGRSEGLKARQKRLAEFAGICRRYREVA